MGPLSTRHVNEMNFGIFGSKSATWVRFFEASGASDDHQFTDTARPQMIASNTLGSDRLRYPTRPFAQRMKRSPRSLLSSFHCAHFTFTQSHLPDLYGACLRFDTMPSRPRGPHSARSCSPSLKGSEYRTRGLSCPRGSALSFCFQPIRGSGRKSAPLSERLTFVHRYEPACCCLVRR